MPKFEITMREVLGYTLVVEADNEVEAEEEAEAVFVDSDTSKIPMWVIKREVDDVKLVDDGTPLTGESPS